MSLPGEVQKFPYLSKPIKWLIKSKMVHCRIIRVSLTVAAMPPRDVYSSKNQFLNSTWSEISAVNSYNRQKKVTWCMLSEKVYCSSGLLHSHVVLSQVDRACISPSTSTHFRRLYNVTAVTIFFFSSLAPVAANSTCYYDVCDSSGL